MERNAPTELLLARVKAYAERRYEGNLLDLVQPYGYGTKWRGGESYRGIRRWRMRYLFRPWKLGLSSSLQLKRLAESRGFIPSGGNNELVYVSNRELDGFIERFKLQESRVPGGLLRLLRALRPLRREGRHHRSRLPG